MSKQLSLFDIQTQDEPIASPEVMHDPTREELLAVLEQLMQAVLDVCDLPETVRGVSLGVAHQEPRTDLIAKGYRWREHADELKLARLIFSIRFKLVFSTHIIKLRAKPDAAIVERAEAIMNAYYTFHPVKED